jgi:flagellar hook-length control protein FliK
MIVLPKAVSSGKTTAATAIHSEAIQTESHSAWPKALHEAAQTTENSPTVKAGTADQSKAKQSPVNLDASPSSLLALVTAVSPRKPPIITASPDEPTAAKKRLSAVAALANPSADAPTPDTKLIIAKKHDTARGSHSTTPTITASSTPPNSVIPQVQTAQAAMPEPSDPATTNNMKDTVLHADHASQTSTAPAGVSSTVVPSAATVQYFVHNYAKTADTKMLAAGLQNLGTSVASADAQSSILPSTQSSPPSAAQVSPPTSIAVNAAGLAAAITALHQAGESSAVIRLSPPGLGDLSVHVSVGQNAQVNVLLVSAIPQTVQLLHNNLDDLRQAMAASGLNLGEANVGGGGNQKNFTQTTPREGGASVASIGSIAAKPAASNGIRAVA